jgi:hypothetical protein
MSTSIVERVVEVNGAADLVSDVADGRRHRRPPRVGARHPASWLGLAIAGILLTDLDGKPGQPSFGPGHRVGLLTVTALTGVLELLSGSRCERF